MVKELDYSKLSNRKFIESIYEDFSQWVRDRNLLFNKFNQISESLSRFLITYIFDDEESCVKVMNCFNDVIDECNDIDFNDPANAIAFIVTHFLNRYHRFQKIGMRLLKKLLFPIRTKTYLTTDILSVGCGPAPSLFALSDLFSLLKQYGRFENIDRLENLKFRTDYVEISKPFRDFLHRFVEYTNPRKLNTPTLYKIIFRPIPYHHGSFYNAFNLQQEKSEIRAISRIFMDEDDFIDKQKYLFKYNLIIFSYFITTKEILDNLFEKNVILNFCYLLRSGGLLVIVGAKGYEEIYKKIELKLSSTRFTSFSMKKRIFELMEYDYFNKYGTKIREFNQKILNRLKELNNDDKIQIEDLELFKITQNKEPAFSKWQLLVYQKESHRSFK